MLVARPLLGNEIFPLAYHSDVLKMFDISYVEPK